MKKHFTILLITVLAAALSAPVAFAQASGTVKGTAKDAQGNSIMMVINPDSLTDVAEHTQAPAPHKEAPLAGAIQGAPNSGVPAPTPKP